MSPFIIPAAISFFAAITLAILGRSGWGWFLLVAFLLAPVLK